MQNGVLPAWILVLSFIRVDPSYVLHCWKIHVSGKERSVVDFPHSATETHQSLLMTGDVVGYGRDGEVHFFEYYSTCSRLDHPTMSLVHYLLNSEQIKRSIALASYSQRALVNIVFLYNGKLLIKAA